MKVALTGAGGLVGRFIHKGLLAQNHDVITLSRADGFELGGEPPSLRGCNALVHAAFDHLPGKYRGGEGDDPEGFIERNLTGTCRLFDQAAKDGLSHVVFLSSRAVYGGYPLGTSLTEDMPMRPDTLYGTVKARAEDHLRTLPVIGVNLRATGVYGPGRGHKWEGLFADYLAGKSITPRAGTEVHGDDLAQAVDIALTLAKPSILNVSDIILDRKDLLQTVQSLTGCDYPLPENTTEPISVMTSDRLRSLGWEPQGMVGLVTALTAMLSPTP